MSTAVSKHNVEAVSPIDHAPRVFHTFPGSNYVLPADREEEERLFLQHRVLKVAFEGEVLLAPVNKSDALFVLDSGTGSAVWLTETAAQISTSAILHGIDIESRLFPTSKAHNVSFSVNSVTSLPTAWTGRFDFVHQRLLLAALQSSEWPRALSEMYRVLAPGGWIQLGEAGQWHAGPTDARLASLVRALFESRGLLLDIAVDLPKLVEEAGFESIKIEKRLIPLGRWAGSQGRDASDNFLGVSAGMKTPILRSGGFGLVSSEKEFDELIEAVRKEWDEYQGAEIVFHIILAKKP